jgi:magnesium-transporting ATPase (P-type)
VICTDKTGTLTQNKMTVGNLRADGELFAITGEGYQPVGEVRRNDRRAELRECRAVRLSLQAAMLASDARLEPEPAASGEGRWRMVGDPTEGALVVAAAKADLHRERVEALYPRVAEVPFDSDRKRMSTIHRVPGSHFAAKDAAALSVETPYVAFVKGAPALALEKGEPGVMDKPPRPPGEPFITRSMVLSLALQSAAVTAVSLFAFWIGRSVFGTVEAARAMAFVALSGCQLVRAYTNRSESASLFSLGVFTNKWMQYAVASSAVLLAAVLYIPGLNKVFDAIPLSARQWAYLAPLLVFPAVVDELTKLARRGARNSRGGSLRGAAA